MNPDRQNICNNWKLPKISKSFQREERGGRKEMTSWSMSFVEDTSYWESMAFRPPFTTILLVPYLYPWEKNLKTWNLSTKHWQKHMKIHTLNHNIWGNLNCIILKIGGKWLQTNNRWIPYFFSLNHPSPSNTMITKSIDMKKTLALSSKSYNMPLRFLLVLLPSPHTPFLYRNMIWVLSH